MLHIQPTHALSRACLYVFFFFGEDATHTQLNWTVCLQSSTKIEVIKPGAIESQI